MPVGRERIYLGLYELYVSYCQWPIERTRTILGLVTSMYVVTSILYDTVDTIRKFFPSPAKRYTSSELLLIVFQKVVGPQRLTRTVFFNYRHQMNAQQISKLIEASRKVLASFL